MINAKKLKNNCRIKLKFFENLYATIKSDKRGMFN